MNEQIRAVLFDCDGVLQRPANDWAGEIADLTGLSGEALARFHDDLEAADHAAVAGAVTFGAGVAPVLRRWDLDLDPAALVGVMQHIAVDPAMLEAVAGLRAAGIRCGLGTNQHPERAAYMRRELGYERLFDPIVISAEIGAAKPQPAFFRYAVDLLGVPAGQVLFVDDVLANVESARGVGLVAEHFVKDAGRPELDRILAHHHLAERVAA